MRMMIHVMSRTKPRRGGRFSARCDTKTELPFQKACPNMAIPSITGSDVGSFSSDLRIRND
jgi:hypothetical protein